MLLFIFILNYVNQSPKDILTDSKNLLESHKNVKLWGHNGRYSHTVETTSSSFDTRWGNYDRKVNCHYLLHNYFSMIFLTRSASTLILCSSLSNPLTSC